MERTAHSIRNRWKRTGLFLLLLFVLLLSPARSTSAAAPVKITSCALTSSKYVRVKATLSNLGKVYGKKCYLFALPLSGTKLTKTDRPLQVRNKAKNMNFSVSLNRTKTSSRLYSKFVIASKNKNGGYTLISNLRYISNPQKAAKYTYRFPTVSSKKGLSLGLWTTNNPNSPEWADQKKYAWDVFKYMDSNQSASVTNFALEEIGADSWNSLITNYDISTYQKYTTAATKLQLLTGYQRRSALPSAWTRYGAQTGLTVSEGAKKVLHDGRRNRNCLWGVSQSFSKAQSFAGQTSFFTTLKVSGSTTGKVQIKIRIFSGNNHILEGTQTIPVNQYVRLGASLGAWSYRSKVTKIQILVMPTAKSGWRGGAAFYLREAVRG